MLITLTHNGAQHFCATLAQLNEAGVPANVVLAAVKARGKIAIDAEAERQRLRWITGGAGQAMTYARKVDEAKAVQTAGDLDPKDFPLLAASIGINGDDLKTVAATVLAMDKAWAMIGAAIEAARLAAKKEVDEARTPADVFAVTAAWPDGAG